MKHDQHRGLEAQRLLEEPLLNEAIAQIEQNAIDELVRLPFWKTRRQRMLLDRIKVIREIRQYIHSVALTGQEVARRRPTVV